MLSIFLVQPHEMCGAVRKTTRGVDQTAELGQRVYALRRKTGMSQEKLAELADLHRNYVGGVERGERNVSLLNIVKLAHGLRVRTTKLMDRIH